VWGEAEVAGEDTVPIISEDVLALLALFGAIAVPVGLLIGAGGLRLACRVCQVPVPAFTPAVGIVLAARLAAAVLGFGVASGYVMAGVAAGVPQLTLIVLLGAVLFVVGLFVHAGLYSAMLRGVDFARGVLIWLAELVFTSAVATGLAILGLFVIALTR
jgi:hypothetical protein